MAANIPYYENGGYPARIPSLFSLSGKTAIVSGGSSGIGLAIVEILAEAGANVAILYHNNNAAVDSAKTVEKRYKVKCRCINIGLGLKLTNFLTCNDIYYRCCISNQCL